MYLSIQRKDPYALAIFPEEAKRGTEAFERSVQENPALIPPAMTS
jgi:hypothetical protein